MPSAGKRVQISQINYEFWFYLLLVKRLALDFSSQSQTVVIQTKEKVKLPLGTQFKTAL